MVLVGVFYLEGGDLLSELQRFSLYLIPSLLITFSIQYSRILFNEKPLFKFLPSIMLLLLALITFGTCYLFKFSNFAYFTAVSITILMSSFIVFTIVIFIKGKAEQ